MTTTVTVVNKLHDKGARTGHWVVKVNGRKASGPHRSKDVAVKKGRQKGRAHAPAVLKVQNTKGHWRTEATY